MTRDGRVSGMAVAAAAFGFYLPSSIGTVISRELSIASIAGTFIFLAAILVTAKRTTPPAVLVLSASLLGLLTLFTMTSSFERNGPGVILLYASIAVLYTLDLRVSASPSVERAFAVIVAITLVAGYALALNVSVADRIAYGWYNSFYPELLYSMVIIFDKPVLTFGTHAIAGLMIYILFYLQLKTYQACGGAWRLGAALALIGLLVLLRSTTGTILSVVAGVQAAWPVLRAHQKQAAPVAVMIGLAAVGLLIAAGLDPTTLYARFEEAILGDRVSGLAVRYAADGLLASNFTYLSNSPFSPIGFATTETLFLGDSGIVVNLLRGSVPLLLLVYGGFLLFLLFNLRDRRAALWLWCVVVLFEVAHPVLQYFRFVAFVPLLVVYLNSLASRPLRAHDASTYAVQQAG
jgi:hypothetical protein